MVLWGLWGKGLALFEGGDFEALHCQPSRNPARARHKA